MTIGAFARGAVLALTAQLFLAHAAGASQVLFDTPANAKDALGNPINAEASIITTGSGLTHIMTILLTNKVSNPIEAGQLLSGFGFTLAIDPNNDHVSFQFVPQSSASIDASQGSEILIAADGSFTPSPIPNVVATGWAIVSNAGASYNLCDLCPGGGGAGPKHTIIGDPVFVVAKGAFLYDAAVGGSGIAGDGSNNPFLTSRGGAVRFDIKILGLSDAVYADTASFSFGTGQGTNLNLVGVCTQSCDTVVLRTPEPSTLMLIGAGLVGLAGYGWRKRRASR